MMCAYWVGEFKPGVDQEAGSPAILLGHYIEGWGRKVYYDGHPQDVTVPLTYVIHDHKKFKDFDFNKGSVVLILLENKVDRWVDTEGYSGV